MRIIGQSARALDLSLRIAAVFWILVYLVTAVRRVRYPFELESIEGHCLQQVCRVLDGQALYVAPSLRFVPLIYTPLYFYAAAAASQVFGQGLVALRVVSILASLGSLFLIFRIVQKRTDDWHCSLLATGLFAGSYNVAASWFDLGRVDSLFLFLLLLAAHSMTLTPSPLKAVGTAVVVFAAFMTKQSALIASAPLLVYYLWRYPRDFLWLAAALFTLLSSSTILLDRIHDGWYSYYVFAVPAKARLRYHFLFSFWTDDVVGPFFGAVLCCLAQLYVSLVLKIRRVDWFYFFFACGALIASQAGRLHFGGYKNALMPAHAALAILFGIAVHEVSAGLEAAPSQAPLLRLLIPYICLTQFATFVFFRFPYVPKPRDIEAGTMLQNAVRAVEGDVFMPGQNMLPASVGKASSAQRWAIGDVMRVSGRGRELLAEEIPAALRDRRFAAIVSNRDCAIEVFGADIDRYYTRKPIELGGRRAERMFGRLEMYAPRSETETGEGRVRQRASGRGPLTQ
jgi:Dolichyl-phosphate-mannose-protein mannosyltransferase